jgi:hypothetical protein
MGIRDFHPVIAFHEPQYLVTTLIGRFSVHTYSCDCQLAPLPFVVMVDFRYRHIEPVSQPALEARQCYPFVF